MTGDTADDLPLDLVLCAITAGCTPRAVEQAYAERGQTDTVQLLSREAGVAMTLIAALAARWGIRVGGGRGAGLRGKPDKDRRLPRNCCVQVRGF